MNLKRELKVYFMIILIVALAWHNKQWLSHPIEHLMGLPYGGAFGVPGIIHPLVFGFGIYILVWIPRLIVKPFLNKK